MYLIYTSRLREQPLHIISLGASGTGKTYLQEKISGLIPEDHKLEITTLSENALYYFEKQELKNKLVLIEDLDGAQDDKIMYALRELMSKKQISKTIPIKDSQGNLKTITLQVEGPITLSGTTTREKLYEDNANRSILIYLDNSKTHKEKIMNYQRKLSSGNINKTKEEKIKEFIKDLQSILKPIKVQSLCRTAKAPRNRLQAPKNQHPLPQLHRNNNLLQTISTPQKNRSRNRRNVYRNHPRRHKRSQRTTQRSTIKQKR